MEVTAKIVVGPVSSPVVTFEADSLVSVNEDCKVSVIGDELYIDTLNFTVRYKTQLEGEFAPSNYDSIETADDLIFHYFGQYDIRDLEYGTEVWLYRGIQPMAKYYYDSCERISVDTFSIRCVSMIGLIDRMTHHGGVYNGESLRSVLNEIIPSGVRYSCDSTYGNMNVYGYLPYGKARDNLQKLLMAFNLMVFRDRVSSEYYFGRISTSATSIQSSNIFIGGKTSYSDKYSRVDVTEYTYYADLLYSREEIANVGGYDPDVDSFIVFSKPYIKETLMWNGEPVASDKCHSTWAKVSGRGKLEGVPYSVYQETRSRNNPNVSVERIVSISGNGMISPLNSTYVMENMCSYYFNAYTVSASIIRSKESCGNSYKFTDEFGDEISGVMVARGSNVSSFEKSECEFVVGFNPCNYVEILDTVHVWSSQVTGQKMGIPSKLKGSGRKNKKLRIMLVGKGDSGEKGSNGEDGSAPQLPFNTTDYGKGGRGGKGGKGGQGGRILIKDLDLSEYIASESSTVRYTMFTKDIGERDNDIGFYIKEYYSGEISSELSSADGIRCDSGYFCLLSNKLYGRRGADGLDGADGGDGLPADTSSGVGFSGRSIDSKLGTASSKQGGSGSSTILHGSNYIAGCGGGGSSYENDGSDASSTSGGGTGADSRYVPRANNTPIYSSTIYDGCGGSGGCGGGGGGGGSYGLSGSSIVALPGGKAGKFIYYELGQRDTRGDLGYPTVVVMY